MPYLPCILCGRKLEKRTSTRNKPYFHCDSCLLQLFVRGKLGIERLEDVFKNIERAELPFRIHAQHLYEIQALLKEISGVKGEIDKLGNAFFMSDDKLRVRNSLKQKLENLLFQLEQMAQEKTERP